MEEEKNKLKKVLVFGVFDKLHDGHRFFLEEAHKLGDSLTIVVARDQSVLLHKGREPREPAATRQAALASSFPNATVLLGDEISGSWQILSEQKPDIIALGYDQNTLKKELEAYYLNHTNKPSIVSIIDHRGDELHTSLLH
jgi:FAD synthetase